ACMVATQSGRARGLPSVIRNHPLRREGGLSKVNVISRGADASTVRRFVALFAVLSLVISTFAMLAPSLVSADGDGSGAECQTAYNVDAEDPGQSENKITYWAPPDWTITGVCIKSGAD